MRKIKNSNHDLEKRKPVLFQLGLICALSLSVAAFEWTNYSDREWAKKVEVGVEESIPIEEIFSTIPDKPKVKERKEPTISDIIDLKDDKAKASEDPKPEPTKLDFDLDSLLGEDFGDCDDCPEDNIVIETKNAVEVANKPHYTDCALADDMLLCTKEMIVNLVQSNARYPRTPFERGIEDTVFVQFTVDELGNIIDVKVAREGDPHLDKEAIRAVKTLPKMVPGTTEDGIPVKTIFRIPVTFRIG